MISIYFYEKIQLLLLYYLYFYYKCRNKTIILTKNIITIIKKLFYIFYVKYK